jgi:regulator of protease activity HflC (stomatin/prohibitin superfamily)
MIKSPFDRRPQRTPTFEKPKEKIMNARTIIAGSTAVVIGLFALTIVGGSFYTIDSGDRGVILRNGAVVGTAEPGLGFKLPIIDSIKEISVRSNARVYEDMVVFSKDQQRATLTVSVNYRLPPDQVEKVYSEYGGEDGLLARLLDRQALEASKNVFGKFTAATAINEWERISAEIQTALQSSVVGPVIIESVQVEGAKFSEDYVEAVADRMKAEVEVAKVRQNAEREKVQAEIVVTQAQAQADAQLAQAKAAAEATRLRGEAEAAAIRAKADALRDNAGLIALTQAERWDGKLPTTMIPGSTVPFMDMTQK